MRTYLRNLILFAVGASLLAAVGAGAWVARREAMGLVHPARAPVEESPADYGIERWETVEFAASDGLQLTGWFIPPAPDAGGATVIFVHGLGSNRASLLNQAAIVIEHGYGALLIDLRNHGDSAGTTTTLGFEEVKDVEGAVDYLLARPEVDPDRIAIVGHSMGGGTVLRAAARIPEIDAVVAESAFTSLEDNIAQGVRALTGLPPFPFAPLGVFFGEVESGLDISAVRPIDDLARIAPRPVLFIHGEQDQTVDVGNTHQLYAAASEPKEFYVIPNAGHGGLVEADPETFEQTLIGFLDDKLR